MAGSAHLLIPSLGPLRTWWLPTADASAPLSVPAGGPWGQMPPALSTQTLLMTGIQPATHFLHSADFITLILLNNAVSEEAMLHKVQCYLARCNDGPKRSVTLRQCQQGPPQAVTFRTRTPQ